MNIDQLLVFKAIVEGGTLHAASQKVGRTQPAISAALKSLESSIGFELFDRTKYRPKITERGIRFLEGAEEVISKFAELESYAKELAGDHESRLTIAIDSAVPLSQTLPQIELATSKFKGLKVEFIFGVMNESVEALDSNRASLALTPIFVPKSDYDQIPIGKTKLIPCIHKKHGALNSIIELKKTPLIIVGTGQDKQSPAIPKLGGGKRIYVSNHAVKEDMILGGWGWGRMSEQSANHASLHQIKNSQIQNIDLEWSIVWRKDRPLGPAAKAVVKSCCGR